MLKYNDIVKYKSCVMYELKFNGMSFDEFMELDKLPTKRIVRYYKVKPYRFRRDPVPGIHRRPNYSKMKRDCAVRERRRLHEDRPYVRGKRLGSNLPDCYNDNWLSYHDKYGMASSWKRVKKKKQWMKKGATTNYINGGIEYG